MRDHLLDAEKNKGIHLMDYMPQNVNRVYADLKLFSDKLLGFKRIRAEFYQKMGYPLNLSQPTSYNEKIIWKKLFDRNPKLTLTSDKFKVREYLESKLGKVEADKIIIPLYYVTDNPDTIPFDEFPDSFVVKPNHGSKMHIIVDKEKDTLKTLILERSKMWLKVDYGLYHFEWAYRDIKRLILVEELLKSKDGELPSDYKFFCFHGKCHLIRASLNRFGEEDNAGYYDRDWSMIPVIRKGYKTDRKKMDQPPQLEQMIHLSEKLSEDFDAVRVDFYNFNNSIYFGELTHYSASGLAPFIPQSYDFELGKHWEITPGYWLNGH